MTIKFIIILNNIYSKCKLFTYNRNVIKSNDLIDENKYDSYIRWSKFYSSV